MFLPNYFIPEVNIIKNLDKPLVNKILKVIRQDILPNIENIFNVTELNEILMKVDEIKTILGRVIGL